MKTSRMLIFATIAVAILSSGNLLSSSKVIKPTAFSQAVIALGKLPKDASGFEQAMNILETMKPGSAEYKRIRSIISHEFKHEMMQDTMKEMQEIARELPTADQKALDGIKKELMEEGLDRAKEPALWKQIDNKAAELKKAEKGRVSERKSGKGLDIARYLEEINKINSREEYNAVVDDIKDEGYEEAKGTLPTVLQKALEARWRLLMTREEEEAKRKEEEAGKGPVGALIATVRAELAEPTLTARKVDNIIKDLPEEPGYDEANPEIQRLLADLQAKKETLEKEERGG